MKKEIDNNQILQNNKDIIYQNFKVENLFKLQKISNKLSKENLSNKHSYPAYSSDTNNCGIIGYTDKPTFICDKEKPVYIIFGDHTRTLNIARKSFSVLDNVKVLIPCIDNDKVLMYLITKWKKQIPNLGYSRHWKIAKDCTLPLPIKINKDRNPIIDNTYKYHSEGFIPDFDYMEKKIKEIEQEIIKETEEKHKKELELYLKASELDNYELNDEDKEILEYSGFRNPKEFKDENNKRIYKTMKHFKINNLFNKKTIKGYPKNKEDLTENSDGYYIYGQNIKRQYSQKVILDNVYLQEVDPKYPILAYSSSVGEIGMISESFYRSGNNGAFQGLFPKQYKFNGYQLQFILSILKKQFNNFGYSTSMSNIMDLSFVLPIQTDEFNNPIIDIEYKYHPEGYIPDWEFMENYIKAIQKVVIADKAKYNNDYLNNLKKIINE